MATEKKLTKIDKFAMLRAIPAVMENDILLEFIDHEIELLKNKSNGEHKPTKVQKENAELRKNLLEVLPVGKLYTVTQMTKDNTLPCYGMSTQKLSAQLCRMVEDGEIQMETEKRQNFYGKMAETVGA